MRNENGSSDTIAVLLFALLLAACGGGSDAQSDAESNSSTAGSSRLGIVNLTEVDSSGPLGLTTFIDVDLAANFFATSNAFVDAYLTLEPEIPIGTCKVGKLLEDLDSEGGSFRLPVIPGVVSETLTSIDAGLSVNLKTGDTDYKIATRREIAFLGKTSYTYSGDTDGLDDENAQDNPIPDGDLTLRVAGAPNGFPSLTVEIPGAPTMTIIEPALVKEKELIVDGIDLSPYIRPVTADTTFTWEPRKSSDPPSYVRIFASRPLSSEIYVECNVPDTGSFVFPDTIKKDLVGFPGALSDFSRIARHVYFDPSLNTTIIINTERGKSNVNVMISPP
jgi:hypothetical protein